MLRPLSKNCNLLYNRLIYQSCAIRLFSSNNTNNNNNNNNSKNILSIKLPKLSPSFTHGKLIHLYIQPNQYIEPTNLLYDIQTNNLTQQDNDNNANQQQPIVQIEGHEYGTVNNIYKRVGDIVYVDDIIADIDSEDDVDDSKIFVYQAYVKQTDK